jgi:type II secretory pathway pseudopilin PulG
MLGAGVIAFYLPSTASAAVAAAASATAAAAAAAQAQAFLASAANAFNDVLLTYPTLPLGLTTPWWIDGGVLALGVLHPIAAQLLAGSPVNLGGVASSATVFDNFGSVVSDPVANIINLGAV